MSLVIVATLLGVAMLLSVLAAARGLGGPAIALPVIAAVWIALGLALAFMLLPGFDLCPGRTLRRAPDHPDGAPTVALTIDDGPHPDTTPAILEALAAAQVKATFFLVGEHARRHPELARRIAAEGHAVGNHTQRHRLLAFRTRAEVAAEIVECQATLAALGLHPRLFRAPHGFKPFGLHALLAPCNLRLVSWQGTLRDTDAPGIEVLVERALRLARRGRILLLHDNPTTRGQSAAALPEIVSGYRRLGFTFVKLA